MRLTKEDGRVLLGAISAEIESQQWRKMRRDKYRPPLPVDTEQYLQQEDRRRTEELCRVRDKIKGQL